MNTFVTTAMLTWLPSYFHRVKGISMSRASTKRGIVMLLAIIGAPYSTFCGLISLDIQDRLVQYFHQKKATYYQKISESDCAGFEAQQEDRSLNFIADSVGILELF